MPEKPRVLSQECLRQLFTSDQETPSLPELVLGFRTPTTGIKGVHIMNDLAQCTIGGMPAHRGDHLCRIIREDKTGEAEDNSDAALRALPLYSRAYPTSLGPARTSALRESARLLLNFDGGMYRAGDGMASGLATHWSLLGAEGFRRFRLGHYLHSILGEAGRQQLLALYSSDRDPVAVALRPLLWADELQEDRRALADLTLSDFDRSLGQRLTTLLQHPLSKPTLLRYTLLASSLCIVLKILGVGCPGGRPTILALPAEISTPRRPLRQEAVQSLQRGMEALDRHLAAHLPEHPLAEALWASKPGSKEDRLEVSGETLKQASVELVAQARELTRGKKRLFFPDGFAIALGKTTGCIRPRSDQAGWGKYMTLHPDLIEALILMSAPPGAPPLPWSVLWRQLRDELGLIIGASEFQDAQALKQAGVLQLKLQDLSQNSDAMLAMAVRRGVARRLPDSGAEAGGEL